MIFFDTLLQGRAQTIGKRVQELAPGTIAALFVALTATFLGQHYGAPVMLLGLLLGLAMHSVTGIFPVEQSRCLESRSLLGLI